MGVSHGGRVAGVAGVVPLLACLAGPVAGQVPEAAAEIARAAAADYPALTVAVIQDDRLIWAEGFGRMDVGGARSVHAGDPFNVYSVAKPLTAIAVLRQVEAGRLDADRPLSEILPGLPAHLGSLTPRLLAGHLSGVPHYASEEDWRTFSALRCSEPSEAIDHFAARPLVAEPGSGRVYTTYGYVLLSAVLASTRPGRSYGAAMRDLVFRPAGMSSTRLDGPDVVKVAPMGATGDRESEPIQIDASCKFGGGGFVSSAVDLARFGQALWDGSLLSAGSLDTALTPFRTAGGESTGYGWGMDTNRFESDGVTVRWGRHSGGSPGGRSFLVFLPDQRVSVALVANADGPSLRIPATSIAYLVAGVSPG